MLRTFSISVIMLLAVLISGCGRVDELGSVNGKPITIDEYLAVFNGLPAAEQVGVLEPGGRIQLMERIVRKKLILEAWAEDPSTSQNWEQLYSVAFLSDSLFRQIAGEFDYQSYIDSLISCGYSGFSLRVVLLDDSSSAAELAALWNAGNFDDSQPSLSAPWSGSDGSSYRSLAGPVHRISLNFEPLLSMQPGTAHVLPMYGEWCVCLLDLTVGDWVIDETAAGTGLLNHVYASTGEIMLSKGISSLAGNCSLEGTTLVASGSGDGTPVVLLGEDTLTTADILQIMTMMEPRNFAEGIPDELSAFGLPEIAVSPEITLWFYVKSLAQSYALADAARGQGIQVSEGVLSYARAESLVRDRVMSGADLDSTGVADWFSENSQEFMLPERRSVLMGYTDSLSAASSVSVEDFGELSNIRTIINEDGEMVPTPAQVMEAFGPDLGPAIFASDSGVFTGPVYLPGELAGWFKVVEIVPPGPASLEEVYPVAASSAAMESFAERFEGLIGELRNSYPVTVDTEAVEKIDLWGSTQ